MDPRGQHAYRVRLDWGLPGASAILGQSDVAVVVDVLPFTTTLSVAVDAGITVFPYPGQSRARATEFARQQNAVLAVGRSQATADQISLSPLTLRRGQVPSRLVLPSPNGSTIAQHIAATPTVCVGASLRNARAVASWLIARYDPHRATVAVVAAGERLSDGELRPAVEDAWGAGAVVDHLVRGGWSAPSPEAGSARDAWLAVTDDVGTGLLSCASGRELADGGYPEDVEIAAEVDASHCVPVLRQDAFIDEA